MIRRGQGRVPCPIFFLGCDILIKRLLSSGFVLAFVLALVAPVLLAVPASAAAFADLDSLSVTRLNAYISSSWQYVFETNSSSFSNLHIREVFAFSVTNGTADDDRVLIPVGDDINAFYVSAIMYLDAKNIYMTNSSYAPAYQFRVYCSDSAGSFLGTVFAGLMFDNYYEGSGTFTLSVSGAQLPVGTAYISIQSFFGGKNPSTLFTDTSFAAMYGTYSGYMGFSVHTSDFDWVSPGFDTIPSAQPCPFAFSHDGQQVYLSEADKPVLSIFAEGFVGVDLYARFNSLNGTTKTVQMFYDAERVCHYNAFAFSFPDEDSYNTLWVDFLIDGNVIYTTQDCTLYYPGWSGAGPGTSTDSAISESITEVQQDVQAVMDAVGETNDKLDNLQGSVDDIVSGDSGVDSSVTDFKDVSDSLTNSLSDANAVIDSGVESLNGFVSSEQMLGTAAALGSLLSAAFVGNEISICGISGNPFELAVIFFGSMGVIVLVVNYVFRKRGSG